MMDLKKLHRYNLVIKKIVPYLLLLSYKRAVQHLMCQPDMLDHLQLPSNITQYSDKALIRYVSKLEKTNQAYVFFHKPLYKALFSANQQSPAEIATLLEQAYTVLKNKSQVGAFSAEDIQFFREHLYPILHLTRAQLEKKAQQRLPKKKPGKRFCDLEKLARHLSVYFYAAELGLDIISMPFVQTGLSGIAQGSLNMVSATLPTRLAAFFYPLKNRAAYWQSYPTVDKKQVLALLTLVYFLYSLYFSNHRFGLLLYPLFSFTQGFGQRLFFNSASRKSLMNSLLLNLYLYAALAVFIAYLAAPVIDAPAHLTLSQPWKIALGWYAFKLLESFYDYFSLVFKRGLLVFFEIPTLWILHRWLSPQTDALNQKGLNSAIKLLSFLIYQHLNDQTWIGKLECWTQAPRKLDMMYFYYQLFCDHFSSAPELNRGELSLSSWNNIAYQFNATRTDGESVLDTCEVNLQLNEGLCTRFYGTCQSLFFQPENPLHSSGSASAPRSAVRKIDVEYCHLFYQHAPNPNECHSFSGSFSPLQSSWLLPILTLSVTGVLLCQSFFTLGFLVALTGFLMISLHSLTQEPEVYAASMRVG